MAATMVSSSRYCIHLKMNYASPSFWFFPIIYTSPIAGNREEVWQELRDFHLPNPDLWCLAGDFNTVISANEREGVLLSIIGLVMLLLIVLMTVALLIWALLGSLFSWVRGDLKERLDRVSAM